MSLLKMRTHERKCSGGAYIVRPELLRSAGRLLAAAAAAPSPIHPTQRRQLPVASRAGVLPVVSPDRGGGRHPPPLPSADRSGLERSRQPVDQLRRGQ